MIFFNKKRTPVTIAEGNGLVVKKEWLAINKASQTPQKDTRPPDQTFLTYPEWFLVFSPEEQAEFYRHTTSTSFPFMSHTKQIWQSYKIINDQIRDNFPKNNGYHFMIRVIGTSATIEYSMKALYETLIGRISDTRKVVTEEDQFNANYTRAYVDFIKDRPWYEFDFRKQLKTLWTSTPFFGPHFLRKAERRYMLTTELIVKFLYGKLIGLGTKTVYDAALPTTAVVVDKVLPDSAGLAIAQEFEDRSALLYLPRYDKFALKAVELAKKGYTFREIAGNTSAILITVLVPSEHFIHYDNTQVIFSQPIASGPERKRIAFATPVASLHKVLLDLDRDKIFIEHVFDF